MLRIFTRSQITLCQELKTKKALYLQGLANKGHTTESGKISISGKNLTFSLWKNHGPAHHFPQSR
jgi:hypothetical protein